MKKISISGIIGWDVYADSIRAEISNASENEELQIEINSPGGSVFEGMEIANMIRQHKGETTAIISGLAASMGSYIAISADKTKAYEDSVYMIHNASVFAGGDHRDLRKAADVVEALSKMLSKSYAKKTGIEKAEILEMMNEETWLFGEEIKESGFVDEIIESESKDDKEDAVAFQRLVFEDCLTKLKDSEKSKADLEKAAAIFKVQGVQSSSAPTQKKEEAKIEPTQEIKMNLEEYLKSNPSAKTEFDAKIDESVKAEKEKFSGNVDKVSKILMSNAYGESIKKAGIKVLNGEKSYSDFEDLVAISDEMKAKEDSAEIKENQPEITGVDNTATAGIDEQQKIKAEANKLGDRYKRA